VGAYRRCRISLVRVDGHLDLAARERGANLYLPEGVKTMLPWKLTEQLGLGLQPISPALSIGFRVNEGQVEDVEICLSSIKVTRDSYSAVNERMDQEPFASIAAMTTAFRERRHANDAARLDLPERVGSSD
jgi:exoribonuclease-2